MIYVSWGNSPHTVHCNRVCLVQKGAGYTLELWEAPYSEAD